MVTKANAIDTKVPSTNRLISKIKYDLNNQGLKKKIENVEKNRYLILEFSQKDQLQHKSYKDWKQYT